MEGGIAILLIVIAAIAAAFVAAWFFGWGGFVGVRHREQTAREAVREHDGRPEHTEPETPAQEHTHFVGTPDRD